VFHVNVGQPVPVSLLPPFDLKDNLPHSTNSVDGLKKTQTSDPNQNPITILSSSSIGLLREGALAHLRQL